MNQYTRVYRDSSGTIVHVHTQTTPIDFEPVDSPEVVESEDVVIETQGMVRAREILENAPVQNGKLQAGPNGEVVRPLTAQEKSRTR